MEAEQKLATKITSALDIVENIELVEREMLKLEQVECPVRHHFGPGVYIREVIVQAGTFAVGHYQKERHLNVFLKGKVNVIKDGGTTEILTAPMIFTGEPGRKIGMILEDMVWLNIYSTDEKDIAKLEERFLDKSEAFLDHISVDKINKKEDREDFLKALDELGFTEEVVKEQSEYEGDQVPFQDDTVSVKVADSPIHGKGLFATAEFRPGDIVAPAKLAGFRTPAGRYTNHAKKPNAVMKHSEGVFYLEAIDYIKGCCGGRDGDEITIDYKQSVQLLRSLLCQQ